MESDFLTALIPEPAWCLGVRLKPFSLGHLVLLRRVDSPFVSRTSKAVELGDLVLAVILCADDFASGIQFLGEMRHQSRETKRILANWGKRTARLNLLVEAREFSRYVREADRQPEYFRNSDAQTQAIGSPDWQIYYLRLHKLTNLSDTEIWNQPLGKTYCDFVSLCEEEKCLRVKSEEDEEVERIAREYYAKRAAEEASKSRNAETLKN